MSLSGLIIGPVLGSGVILLPPLLFDLLGNYSLIIWIVISFLGFIFAMVFARLSILFKGEGGVSLATKNALGKKYQVLTSLYLIFAVFFGAIAVLLIASEFLGIYFPDINKALLAFYLYIPVFLFLLSRIDFIGKMMLSLTSVITIILLSSSINILLNLNEFNLILPKSSFDDISYAFLIAFWAIVGWEVIGNYSNEVKETKTITKAVIFSALIVSLVYILLVMSIVFGDFVDKNIQSFKLLWVLEPLFGEYSAILLTSITLIFCLSTIILFVGGVARLISSLQLSTFTSIHTSSGAPLGALSFLAVVHLTILSFVYYDIINISNLVAFADGFFIANAIIGLTTAIVIFDNGFLRYSAMILLVLFFAILLVSNIYILLVILSVFLYTYFIKK